jgi:hypothetical protein
MTDRTIWAAARRTLEFSASTRPGLDENNSLRCPGGLPGTQPAADNGKHEFKVNHDVGQGRPPLLLVGSQLSG